VRVLALFLEWNIDEKGTVVAFFFWKEGITCVRCMSVDFDHVSPKK
jgi:hypothetical protein